MSFDPQKTTVCVVGLGYVGLPLAEAFSKHLRVIGYDVNIDKIKKLSQNNECNIEFTSDPVMIREADFVIICVPTPVTKSKEPNLSYVQSTAEIVGKNLNAKRGRSIVDGKLLEKLLELVARLKETKGMRIFKRGFEKAVVLLEKREEENGMLVWAPSLRCWLKDPDYILAGDGAVKIFVT